MTFLLQFICLIYLLLYAWKEHKEFEMFWDGPWDYFWGVIVPVVAALVLFTDMLSN
jgi:hypothetical protein